MTESGRPYGGVPAAERRIQRRRSLFDAGLTLFAERGIASVSIGEICKQARLTKRYFYEQFESMDAFVDALMDNLMTERLTVEPPGAPGPRRLRDRIAAFMDVITADPRVARFVLVETVGATGSLTRLRRRVMHDGVEAMISDLTAAGREERLDVRMSAYALAGAGAELVLAWLDGDVVTSADEIVDYLAELFESVASRIGTRTESVERA